MNFKFLDLVLSFPATNIQNIKFKIQNNYSEHHPPLYHHCRNSIIAACLFFAG